MKAPIQVAAALIFHDSKLLITQRREGDHLGNLWEFPGGKLETGESFEDCLVREIREELGVDVSVGKLLEDITHDYGEKAVRLQFFVCRLISGEAKPIHCQALAWITREELRSYEFPAADAQLIERLERTDFARVLA